MIPLRIGYIICGFATGLILLFNFLYSLPDGKLHIVFCDVGQGDAVYIRLPDGRDMLIDGGPNEKVIACLSRHMAFWDRKIDIIFLTHAEQDHLRGLMPVVSRFDVGYAVLSAVPDTSEQYRQLMGALDGNKVPQKRLAAGDSLTAGNVTVEVMWPPKAVTNRLRDYAGVDDTPVLGVSASGRNDLSLILRLRYGKFDMLSPGDASMGIETEHHDAVLADGGIEVLKVPHHGSKTGMTADYLDALHLGLAVISVGRNTYGHPAPEILDMLAKKNIRVLRTDQEGDIEIISDGIDWTVQTNR
ncbi:MBL fold metallo-hydrolase [Candidatus Gottesmanbacteria bacterium]|nr:MBL fold metallo-hydrolase [Candidatus Gottesmanbacteria bacterium]